MDTLGKRIDELEQHIMELADEAGVDKQTLLKNISHNNNNNNNSTVASLTKVSASPTLPRSPVRAASSKPKVTSTQIEI
jgi:hypothetical protein